MSAERKLFGTDGVRGEAGTFLTAELATSLGRATTASLEAERPQVLIVRDTRESGPMLEAALAAGIAAAGGDALLGGVLPTPAAAILVKRLGLDLAAVVSASHNPYHDNGIKFFSSQGTKLGDELEARIESLMDEAPPRGRGRPCARAQRRPRRLPARARGRLPARPLRPQGRPRLRQRRHLPRRPGDLRAARRRGRDDRRRARRAQHQRRLRLHPHGAAGRAGRRLRGRDRLRLRRRRRPRAGRRRLRPRPRRRRADRPGCPRARRAAAS